MLFEDHFFEIIANSGKATRIPRKRLERNHFISL